MKKILLITIALMLSIFSFAQDMQWEQVKILEGDAYADGSASCVSIYGDYAVVGDKSDSEDHGAVSIYKRSSSDPTSWTLLKKITDPESDGSFGYIVEIHDEFLFVTDYYDRVFIFQKDEGGTDNWGQIKKISATDFPKLKIGAAISANSTTLAVYGYDRSGTSFIDGVVYIFQKDQGGTNNWGLSQTIQAPDTGDDDWFGRTLSLYGTRLAISDAKNNSNMGEVYVYDYSGGSFSLSKTISPVSSTTDQYFGKTLSLGALKLVIGAPYINEVYVFSKTFSGWTLGKTLTETGSDFYGDNLKLDNGVLAVGDCWYDGSQTNSGIVYVYEKDYGGANNWGKKQTITPSVNAVDGNFGKYIDIDDNNIIVSQNTTHLGFIFSPEYPDNQAQSITISDVNTTSVKFNWTDGNGDYRAIFIKQTSASEMPSPENYTSYTANLEFGSGDQIGTTGWYCVYSGDDWHGTGITVTGLTESTNYTIAVCEYNFGTGEEYYNNSSATDNPLTFRTWVDMSSVDVHILNDQILSTTSLMEYSLNEAAYVTCTNGTTENINYDIVTGNICHITVRDALYPDNKFYFEDYADAEPSFTIDYIEEWTNEVATSDYEYNFTNEDFSGTNIEGTGVEINLMPGTNDYLYIRKIATQYTVPSVTQTLTIDARPAATSYTIDYENEQTAENIPSTIEYATNSVFTANQGTGNGSPFDFTPGTDMYFRVLASETNPNFSGENQLITVANRPDAPTNPDVDDANDTFGWDNVSGYTSASDYEYSADNGSSWTTCSANPINVGNLNVAAGNFLVRVKASNTNSNFYGNELASDDDFTYVDNTNPVITTYPSDQTVDADANCEASLVDYTGDVTATDNSGIAPTITQSPTAGTTISGATNTITVTATDGAGNYTTETFNVAVEDNTAPSITSTHNDQTVDANDNCEASLPDYTGDVVATDNCDNNLTITQSPSAGTTISGATNSVTLTVTDDDSNSAEVTFNVEVEDNTNPEITSTHSNQTIYVDANCEITLPDYTVDVTATDNCDDNLDVTQSPAAGTTYYLDDIITVFLTVTDDNSNTDMFFFDVTVEDNTAPVITSTHDDIVVSGDASCQYTLLDYTGDVVASDNCSANLTITQSPTAGTVITGYQLVTLTVEDENENSADVEFSITLNDDENPVLTTQNFTLYLEETGNATLKAENVTVSASDNCTLADTTLSQTSFDCSNIGTPVEIDVTLSDAAGNQTVETANITVLDTISPSVECIDAQTVTTSEGETVYTVVGTEFDPTATDDNCEVSSVINDFNSTATLSGAEFPIGTTTVTWTVTDASGNETDCSFDVQVNAFVGISDLSEIGISIYPNPTNGIFTIETTNNFDMTITDVSGKIIEQQTINNQTEINISEQASGIYFIKFQNSEIVKTLKIIKD